MFNKILSTVSMAVVSAMVLIGTSVSANAAYVDVAVNNGLPGADVIVHGPTLLGQNGDSDFNAKIVGGDLTAGQAIVNNVFTFNVIDHKNTGGAWVNWGGNAVWSEPKEIGVAGLTYTWDTGDVMNLTQGLGDAAPGWDNGEPNWAWTWFTAGAHTLTVSGTLLSGGGGYNLEVSAVPLPPAALLFGTALFGIGALRRRKNKKATELAA